MVFKTLDGRLKKLKGVNKYRIDWLKRSKSAFQTRVKVFLKEYWRYDFVYEEFRIVGTRLSLDFYNASRKVAVEVQGAQHNKFVEFFHGHRENLAEQFLRDSRKWRFCEINGITMVEIYPDDILGRKIFEKQGVIL
jgi:very-short-patch-repair endonuclease